MSEQIEFRTADLEYREESEEGFVEGYAIRYGEVATIENRFKETFERGAFTGSADVKLYRDHREIIGHITEQEDREDGFWFRARIALTSLGKDTLALLRTGALSKFSVGFIPREQRQESGVIIRTKALLREISVVERPAYAGATVLAVRADESPIDPEGITTMTDTVSPEELAQVRTEAFDAVEELQRSFIALTNRGGDEEVIDQRSAGALLKAIVAGDEEAIKLYNRAQEHLHDEVQARAYTGGTTAQAPVKDAWVGDLTRIFDSSSGALSNFFAKGTLPATGNNIEYAQLKSNTMQVTEQVAEGDDLAYGEIELEIETAPVKTYGGYTQLTRQAIERSTLPVLNRSLEALAVAAGARKKAVLRAAVAATIAAREAVTLNGGVVLLGATLAAATASNWEDALIDAAIKYDGEAQELERMFVSATVFKKLRSLTVSGERVFQVDKGNASGTLDLPGLRGDFGGIPVSLDVGQAGDKAYFANHRAIRQYDSALYSLSDENIINLSKDYSVYFYGAVAPEIPQLIVPVKLAAS